MGTREAADLQGPDGDPLNIHFSTDQVYLFASLNVAKCFSNILKQKRKSK